MRKLLLILALVSINCNKEALLTSFPLSDHLESNYYIYRTEIDGVVQYYSNSETVTDFLGSWGINSPNIFNFAGLPIVDSPDLLNVINGYGQAYTPAWDIYEGFVSQTFSSGWELTIPGWDIVYLKVTPNDEACVCFVPDILNSFLLEGIINGHQYKVWYH